MQNTYLAQAIQATNDAGVKYDTSMKYLLADRQILARILKYAVREFEDMPLQDIMDSIGNDIEIGTRAVDPGLSNLGHIEKSGTEDAVPGEGTIFYDLRFTVYHKKREMKFLINCEAQKSSEPCKLGYHLENRIVFYLARMISAQKQQEFFHSDYDSLKPVRSIWLCMDDREDCDSIEEISLSRKTMFGKKPDDGEMDLVRGIIVNIRSGENLRESPNLLISMLEKLLSPTDEKEKKRILSEEYGMIMTTELERRMQVMCNWSENIREQAIKQGVEQGIKQGVEQGIKTERCNAIRRLIKANIAKEQIVSMGYTEDEFAEAQNA